MVFQKMFDTIPFCILWMPSNSAESTGKSVKPRAYYIKLLIFILWQFLIKSGRSMAAHTHTRHTHCMHASTSVCVCVCTQQFPIKETGCACSRLFTLSCLSPAIDGHVHSLLSIWLHALLQMPCRTHFQEDALSYLLLSHSGNLLFP